MNLMIITNQKPTMDTQKLKIKEHKIPLKKIIKPQRQKQKEEMNRELKTKTTKNKNKIKGKKERKKPGPGRMYELQPSCMHNSCTQQCQ